MPRKGSAFLGGVRRSSSDDAGALLRGGSLLRSNPHMGQHLEPLLRGRGGTAIRTALRSRRGTRSRAKPSAAPKAVTRAAGAAGAWIRAAFRWAGSTARPGGTLALAVGSTAWLLAASGPTFAGPLPGGVGFVTVLAYDADVNLVVNVDRAVAMDAAGMLELQNLGTLAGEAFVRFDPDPLGGYELRLTNTAGSAIQGVLVLGVPIEPTGGGLPAFADFEVEYLDGGGGGVDERVQQITFLTEDDRLGSINLVGELQFDATVRSEEPLGFCGGPASIPEPVRGSRFVEFDVQVSFTLDVGDSLLVRGVTSFPDPPVGFCGEGADEDQDGVEDTADNCLGVFDPEQRDTNRDGYGNLCDADLENGGFVDFVDLDLLKSVFFSDDDDADLDDNGLVDFVDLGLFKALFFQPPGPSGLSCAGTIPCP